MFKDELIELQKNANLSNLSKDTLRITVEFKEAIKNCVTNGIGKKDSQVSFTIVGGKIFVKSPLYNNPTCFIEDLSVIEPVFKKEGVSIDVTYCKKPGNGTLTFRW